MSNNSTTSNNEINNNNGTEHLTEILNEDGNDSGNMDTLVSRLKLNKGNSTDNNDVDNSLGSSVKKSTSSKNIAISTLLATLAKLIETSSNVVDANTAPIDIVEEITSKSKLDARSTCQMGGSETSHLTLGHPQSNTSTGSIICRICHNNENIDRLISPCLCKGSLAYVHRYCVEYWLSRSGTLHCELCMHPFNTRNTLRYGFFESLRIWYRHPNNRGLLQSDVLTCALLTVVSLGLIAMSFLSLRYFMMQGARIGLSRFWTQSSIIMFLCIVLFAYSINLFFIIRGQIIPWYRWWRSARQVHLILDPV